jgi:hypothetical protein
MSQEMQRIQMVFGLFVVVAIVVSGVFAYAYFGWFGIAALGALVAWMLLDGIATELPGWLGRAKLKRRAREGRCLSCGYDLRGNPQSRICPECGKSKGDVAAT